MFEGPPELFKDAAVRDPYPAYRWLRENAPVYREPESGLWMVTRFEDVRDALTDHVQFSSQLGPGHEDPERVLILVNDDPPRHDVLRVLLAPFFGRRALDALTPRIEAIAETLIDALDPSEVEVIDHLAVPLPVFVMTEILGIPPVDRWRFLQMRSPDPRTPLAERTAAFEDIVRFLQRLIRRRAAEPRDDLISHLTRAEVDGQPLREWEIVSFCIVLLVAGNETTSNLIGNFLNRLAREPEEWQLLRASASRVPDAVEEMVRLECPVQVVFRKTTVPVVIAGSTVPAGAVAGLCVGSANRDPDIFARADSFEPSRQGPRHVGFGSGIHGCIGGALARLEVSTLIRMLAERFAELAPRGEPIRQVASPFAFGFERLPVTLN